MQEHTISSSQLACLQAVEDEHFSTDLLPTPEKRRSLSASFKGRITNDYCACKVSTK